MTCYLHKISLNPNSGVARFIIANKKTIGLTTINGMEFWSRIQVDSFGLVQVINPHTNALLHKSDPYFEEFTRGMKIGDEFPGYKITEELLYDNRGTKFYKCVKI